MAQKLATVYWIVTLISWPSSNTASLLPVMRKQPLLPGALLGLVRGSLLFCSARGSFLAAAVMELRLSTD